MSNDPDRKRSTLQEMGSKMPVTLQGGCPHSGKSVNELLRFMDLPLFEIAYDSPYSEPPPSSRNDEREDLLGGITGLRNEQVGGRDVDLGLDLIFEIRADNVEGSEGFPSKT